MLKQDLRSEESSQWRHLYKKARWIKARAHFLRHHPLCAFCQEEGIAKGADVVDHIVSHKGNLNLFWDEKNWQPLCFHHHNSTKQSLEKSGPQVVTGLDGWPTME